MDMGSNYEELLTAILVRSHLDRRKVGMVDGVREWRILRDFGVEKNIWVKINGEIAGEAGSSLILIRPRANCWDCVIE